ncbi:hypothetical protein WKI68_40485 [Streptomyces sp. MS1.HAVA.3]|uniref:Uncharacterized protein n=1 Tax=Streptomyces caledonius TaxID=3134107 RepID=A0ABU8UE68_9ACTN
MAPDVRIIPAVSGALTIQVEIVRARALDVHPVGDDAVEITGELAAEVGAVSALQAVHVSTGAVLSFPLETGAAGSGRIPFTARVPLAELAAVPDAEVDPGEWAPSPGACPSSAQTAPSTAWPTTSAAASTAWCCPCRARSPAAPSSPSAATPGT